MCHTTKPNQPINFRGLFNAKAITVEEQLRYYLTHSWGDKGVHILPKGICPNVNEMVRLEFELACYNILVQQVSLYTTRTLCFIIWPLLEINNNRKCAKSL